jgi:hypothetical protein
MTKLNDRPVRPRSRSAQPSYPRKLALGAVALMTAMASTAVGCANIVETAEGDETGDEPSWFWELPDPYENDDNNNNSTGGDFGGGIGEEWIDEGGGGAGGEEAGGGGAGGDEAGGGQGQGGDLGS